MSQKLLLVASCYGDKMYKSYNISQDEFLPTHGIRERAEKEKFITTQLDFSMLNDLCKYCLQPPGLAIGLI